MTANATGLRKSTYIVQKMDCPAEEQLIRNRLEDDAPVFAALRELNMEPERQGGEGGASAAPASAVSTRTKWLVGLSGVMAIAAEIIGAAMRCMISDPAPELHRVGNSPAMMAATVIIFGRTRSTAPAIKMCER